MKTNRATKGQRFLIGLTLLALLLVPAAGSTLAQGPVPQAPLAPQAQVGATFTYQGQLKSGGSPYNGTCDLQFSLWDAAGSGSPPTGGAQVGATQPKTGVTVSEGLFTVELSFADAFTGDARWLQIAVRCPAGSGTYTTLSPRQLLTPAPYALSLRPGATIHNKATSGATMGLTLRSDSGDGVFVDRAGNPSGTYSHTLPNGFEVAGAQGYGLYVGRADAGGVYVVSAGVSGVSVSRAGGNGVYVDQAGRNGVSIAQTGYDGVWVYQAGSPTTTTLSNASNGFEVAGAQGNGLFVGRADERGVYVSSSGTDGVYVHQAGAPSSTSASASQNGFEVAGAQGHGLYVGQADLNGVHVYQAGNPTTALSSYYKNGFAVEGAEGYGLYVGRADQDGVLVYSSGGDGVHVNDAGSYGVYVHDVGTPTIHIGSTSPDGFEVAGAQGNGLWVGRADGRGVYVSSSGSDGVLVGGAGAPSATTFSSGQNGFEVAGAQGNGLWVGRADERGVYVSSSGTDGVYVHQAGNPSSTTGSSAGQNGFEVAGAQGHGLWVGMADQSGVYVNMAANYGVYANTAQASHEWGFYTPDKIYAGTTLASGGPLMLVAQSGDSSQLEPGDVVAISGTGAVLGESEFPTPLVRRAGPGDGAVMGVVYRRFVSEKRVEEVERDGPVEQQTNLHTRSAEGPIAPGDYMLVVVLGPAQVKVATASGVGVRPGDLLTMAPNGQAARATPETTSYAPGAVIGQAMGAVAPTQGAGLVWVLVMPR